MIPLAFFRSIRPLPSKNQTIISRHIPALLTSYDGVVVVAVPGVGTLEALVFVKLTATLLVAIIEG